MISAGYFNGNDTIPWQLTAPARPAADAGKARRTGARAPTAHAGPPHGARDTLAVTGRVLATWLAAVRRRVGDHLFAMNDTEASWRRWQVTKVHGGLGRHYRDPLFDTLTGTQAPRAVRVKS